MKEFMFATGIENSYPTIKLKDGTIKRVDEMEKTGHYEKWKEDFELVKEMGISYLRYGPPYFSTHIGPGKYNWDFADETFNRLKKLKIIPIADLCHFGVPDWLENFQNPDFPEYFAEYAKAFAKRYPHIIHYTPVNEIFTCAKYSAKNGWWNERLKSDKAFVTAMKNMCKADVLSMQSILKVKADAIFIQSESTEYYHPIEPNCFKKVDLLNEIRFLALDLIYGHPISLTMYNYLMKNGMKRTELNWFKNQNIKATCIMGNNYYDTNEHFLHADGKMTKSGEILGYYVITHQYFLRYKLPVMHTETNIKEPHSVNWLMRQWANVYRLKQDGIPIIGFTWFSLIDQVDWDTQLQKDDGIVNPFGLYDLDRKIRPVGKSYKKLIKDWKDILADESFGMHMSY
jgi:beta-glucosidase/6-phospho-beta-glucosidase/beta-galactosidase